MLAPERTEAPDEMPVTLAEAKAHLRVDHTEEDDLILSLVQAATDHLDGTRGILGRCLVTQTWVQAFDGWATALRLPFPDVQSVTVTYRGADGVTQTVESDDYDLLSDWLGCFVELKGEFSRPELMTGRAVVSVEMTVGFGDAGDVPKPLKSAILLHVGTLYDHRATLSERVSPNMAFEALVSPYRRVRF
jgi:uncharacterized phiE125 gp8 family phage protein